jgi:hypothetical protein
MSFMPRTRIVENVVQHECTTGKQNDRTEHRIDSLSLGRARHASLQQIAMETRPLLGANLMPLLGSGMILALRRADDA